MKNKATIGKPDAFKPMSFKHECPDCESQMIITIKKNSVTGKDVSILRKMTKISDDLRLMQMEKAQEERDAGA